MKRLIVFTDLDGTLLDHDSYCWRPAEQALARIDSAGIPLVFNTSKTIAEVLDLRQALQNRHPFIIENGGAVCIPGGYFAGRADDSDVTLQLFGKPYRKIVAVLEALRRARHFKFRGFSDMTAGEVAERTGLSADQAVRAKSRACSEPILWQDDNRSFDSFRRELSACDLQVVSGGRFFHVMGNSDKGAAMLWLLEKFAAEGSSPFASVALGDGPNDLPMLEAADYSVVIRNDGGVPLVLDKPGNVIYTQETGPRGWQAAMQQILDQKGV